MVKPVISCRFLALIFSSFLFFSPIFCARVIKGNAEEEGRTLSFYPHKAVSTRAGGAVYYAAHPGHAGRTGEYSVCRLEVRKDELEPLMLEKLNITSPIEVEDNPIYNAGILCMDLMEPDEATVGDTERPVIVPANSPFSVFMLNSYYAESKEKRRARLIVAPNLPDATPRLNGGIVAISAAKDRVFYAACGRDAEGRGQPFGTEGSGSGIGQVVLGFVDKSAEKEGQKAAGEKGDDAKKNEGQKKNEMPGGENDGAVFTHVGPAESLDVSSPLVIIGDKAKQLYVTDMYWDPVFSRLYVALFTESGQGGTRSVLMGGVEKYGVKDECKNVFKLYPVAPPEAFNNVDGIIGSRCSDEKRWIRKIRTMHTSTALNYLLVAGGAGDPAQSGSFIRALPLGVGTKEQERGMIAARDAQPMDLWDKQNFFYARCLPSLAQEPDQMPKADDKEVVVGGGPVPAGSILDMFVRNDAVFVSVAKAQEGSEPGLFYSRALFGADGKITNWSSWTRARATFAEDGSIDPVASAKFDPLSDGFTVVVPAADGSSVTVKRTEWSTGDDEGERPEFIKRALSRMPREQGGVHYATAFSPNTPGLDGIALQLFAGNGTITLTQTGRVGPNGDVVPVAAADDDTRGGSPSVLFSGGALETMGRVMGAQIASNGSDSWLFVGGREGLAVLIHDDNYTGCGPVITDGLGELKEGVTFRFVGNYRRIRKLVADGKFLYVLTDKALDRISMSDFESGYATNAVTVADAGQMAGVRGGLTFLDVVVSKKMAFLASNMGLWRVGDGGDIRSDDPRELQWQLVERAGVTLPAAQLMTVTSSGRDQDLATGAGGNLYVLSSSRSIDMSYLHRFAIKGVDDDQAIDPTTVRPLPDVMVRGRRSYFVKYGQYRSMIASDGAQMTSIRNRSFNTPTTITRSHPLYEARTGTRFVGARNVAAQSGYEADGSISSFCRNEATGSPIVAGDFGIRINE